MGVISFCSGDIYKGITSILYENLFSSDVDLLGLYEKMMLGFEDNNIIGKYKSDFIVSKKDIIGHGELLLKKETHNLGIDLPIYFGDYNQSKNKIMIVAMDAKRSNQSNDDVVIGSVFSLNTLEARVTNRNDYWKFIEPMTMENFVYLTDVFKLYYETYNSKNGKQVKVLSNKDKDYTDKNSHAFSINKSILEAEIDIVKPNTIIALGKESASALKTLQGIKTTGSDINHNGIQHIFMPHISRTVTQNIPTVANLFIAMGRLKKDKQMITLGEQIKSHKGKLY